MESTARPQKFGRIVRETQRFGGTSSCHHERGHSSANHKTPRPHPCGSVAGVTPEGKSAEEPNSRLAHARAGSRPDRLGALRLNRTRNTAPGSNAQRHQPYAPQSRRAAPTWSAALPPSSHAVRAHARYKRPSSRTNRRPPAASRVINQALPNPGRRPQLGVRRLRRLPMRSEPTPDPNGQSPAQFDVPRRHPASSTKRSPIPAGGLNLEYGASAVFPCGQSPPPIQPANLPHKSTSPGLSLPSLHPDVKKQTLVCEAFLCGKPPPQIGRGDYAAWQDGGSAVLQVGSSLCGVPLLHTDRGDSAADEDGTPPPTNQLPQARGLKGRFQQPGAKPRVSIQTTSRPGSGGGPGLWRWLTEQALQARVRETQSLPGHPTCFAPPRYPPNAPASVPAPDPPAS